MRSITLFVGMYGITVGLFWVESGSLSTGLAFGILSASLKTAWANVHHRYFYRPPRLNTETVRINEYRKTA